MRKLCVLISLFLFVACSPTIYIEGDRGNDGHDDHEHKFTQHYKQSLFKISDHGLFSLEVVVKGGEWQVGSNVVDLIIHDQGDRDLTGAEVTVTPWMPLHGHGVSSPPKIMERGGGLYSLNDLNLTMSGPWELRVGVKSGRQVDTAVFIVAAGMNGQDHRHQFIEQPADLDFSTTLLSENGNFIVSYISDLGEIPLNKIHSWQLRVESKDGVPVSGAVIKVEGLMPEHGHGFPTNPIVSAELESSSYLVEGLRFNMPGWWNITFEIKAGDTVDSVKFNLRL
ncbi:MAG: FixH family protein [Proteobacteria bacterium]|nr:FixH family protein [Pseudomonadota bacterium]MBU1716253.1 FixH family protein [Pseudomonadota bacterium]